MTGALLDLRRCDAIDLDYASARGISLREAVSRMLARSTRRDDGCLIGPWSDPEKHGEVNASGRRVGAHVAVVLVRGDVIPDGHLVRHTCDVGGCVESSHLITGTPAQNSRDRRRTGPWSYSCRGEARASSVLTADLVATMRRQARLGTQIKAIAAEHGVSYSAARGAIRGLRWRHVSEPPVPCGYRWSHPSPTRVADDIRASALELVETGLTLEQVAARLSISRWAAWAITQPDTT